MKNRNAVFQIIKIFNLSYGELFFKHYEYGLLSLV